MTRAALLGIDLGTTALKAAVFDAATGRALAVASIRLPLRSGPDGMREQDPADVDRAIKLAARRLRRAVGPRWRDIAGLGLSSQGGSAIIADRATGEPLTPMQLWNDTRPVALLAEIAAARPAGYWRKLCWLDGPGAGLARMAWLRRRHRTLFNDANIYVGAGEYAYFTLTGVWRQDAGSALQQGAYDARHHRLSADPLAIVGVPLAFVAPMRVGHSTEPLSIAAAQSLGVPPGLPVAGPYLDHEAGYCGAAAGDSDQRCRPLQCSLGTAWVGNFVSPTGEPPDTGLNLVLPSPVGRGNMICRVMLAGTVTWDWALGMFAGGPVGQALQAVHRKALSRADAVFRERVTPPGGLVGLPWLTRPNPFDPSCSGAGGFVGINSHTTPADLLRATVAGMCCEFARVFQPVREPRTEHAHPRACPPPKIDRVVLTGGAAGGWYFRQWLAGLFAPLPVYHATEDLAGVRGAVYAFGLATPPGIAVRVPPPQRAVAAEMLRCYETYARVCDRIVEE